MPRRKHLTRTVIIQARVTPETHMELEKRAIAKGIYLSDYCNQLFERHCKPRKKK